MTTERTADIYTACKDCVFAKWNSNKTTQIGCEFGRVSKYANMGMARLEKNEDTNVESFIINTLCNACRDKEWADKYENPKEIVIKQISFAGDFIIYSIEQEDAENLIVKSIKSCMRQNKIKPRSIIIVIKNKEIIYQDLFMTLQNIVNDYCPFRIVRILNENESVLNSIDMGVRKTIGTYYIAMEAGKIMPEYLLDKLNRIINEDLIQLSMIYNKDDIESGYVIQTMLHDIFGGNKEMPIYEKIDLAAKDQGLERMVLSWKEI